VRGLEPTVGIIAGIVKNQLESKVPEGAARWIEIEGTDVIGHGCGGLAVRQRVEFEDIVAILELRCLKLPHDVFVAELPHVVAHGQPP
jgi:hypothetical protein